MRLNLPLPTCDELEAGYLDDEELDEARALLKSELGLAEPADPVRSLHSRP
jgi:hypothetical protein